MKRIGKCLQIIIDVYVLGTCPSKINALWTHSEPSLHHIHIRILQCSNGHLMCAGCFTHLLADASFRDETSTCPTCRIEICKSTAIRNLAVENAVSELPTECQFCNEQFPRNSLDRHEEEECEERFITRTCDGTDYKCPFSGRVSGCKFHRIGCPWRGPFHEKTNHEQECGHPNKSGTDVMKALQELDQKMVEERKLYKAIFELLGYAKITFNGALNLV